MSTVIKKQNLFVVSMGFDNRNILCYNKKCAVNRTDEMGR